jgi:hypothetical protein
LLTVPKRGENTIAALGEDLAGGPAAALDGGVGAAVEAAAGGEATAAAAAAVVATAAAVAAEVATAAAVAAAAVVAAAAAVGAVLAAATTGTVARAAGTATRRGPPLRIGLRRPRPSLGERNCCAGSGATTARAGEQAMAGSGASSKMGNGDRAMRATGDARTGWPASSCLDARIPSSSDERRLGDGAGDGLGDDLGDGRTGCPSSSYSGRTMPRSIVLRRCMLDEPRGSLCIIFKWSVSQRASVEHF